MFGVLSILILHIILLYTCLRSRLRHNYFVALGIYLNKSNLSIDYFVLMIKIVSIVYSSTYLYCNLNSDTYEY